MAEFLYFIIEIIAKAHTYLLSLNDNFEYVFSDKELHFIVIGVIGMAMLFVVYPLFKALSKNHVIVIAWIYVFTLIIVLTFAIEIGQKVSNTGVMDFGDIVFGVVGFLAMYVVFLIIRGIFKAIHSIMLNIVNKNRE